jgi:hypothetical protein
LAKAIFLKDFINLRNFQILIQNKIITFRPIFH